MSNTSPPRKAVEGWESWLDPQGRVRWVDARVKESLGLDPHALLAEPDYPARFVPSEARARVRDALAAVVAGAVSQVVDTSIVGVNESVTHATLRFQRVDGAGGEPLGILLAVRLGRPDQAEFLRQVIDIDPNFVFVKDREGRFVLANQSVADAYGTTVEGLEGKTDSDFNPNADEVAQFRQKDAAVIEGNLEVVIPEERITDSTGRVRWLMTVKRPMLGDDGRPKYLLGVASDITQRRDAEEQRRRLDQKLQETQKLESLGLLAGGIAHDFNNLLAAILGNTSLALRRLPADSPEIKLLEQVSLASKRASDLCRQMLAYAGRGRVDAELVDLSTLVRDTAQLLEANVSSKQAKLVLHLSPTLPLVKVDPTQIRQVVMNLVMNAAEAIGDRSGTIEVTTELASTSPPREPASGDGAGYLVLRVADTGAGMSPETMARIFDPFFTTKFTGRGLGLAAVRGIAQSHGGALDVSSQLGRGSTFHLWLPISRAPSPLATVGDGTVARREPVPAGTVLLLDDEATVRDVTSAMLVELGYQVVAVADGAAAIAKVRAEPDRFDLVLCDVMMPGLSGVDTMKELRAIRPGLRVVLMSGFLASDSTIELLRKKYGTADNFDIVINTDKGDLEAFRNRLIVEDGKVEDPNTQVEYSEAVKIEPDFEVGEDVSENVKFSDFGRRAVLAARQNLMARVQELEREGIFKKYKDRVGEIITGEVYQTWKKETLIMDDDSNELILPKNEQIPSDFFKKGDSVRAVVLRVEMMNGTPKIILSRTSPLFLEKLFELEVPEVFDGLITIKKIVREPGERAKVAVESYDDRIDPVGACVGMKGSRIHGIVRELRNENIDVINYTNNLPLFISRALAPAKITSIKLDEEKKRASVFLKPDQVSLAIGKGGHNIKLAGKLSGYEIDVYRDTDDDQEDVDLDEFSDEIEPWIIDELKGIGCDTAKSVLDLPIEDLVRRTDLEEETIKEVVRILSSEFE